METSNVNMTIAGERLAGIVFAVSSVPLEGIQTTNAHTPRLKEISRAELLYNVTPQTLMSICVLFYYFHIFPRLLRDERRIQPLSVGKGSLGNCTVQKSPGSGTAGVPGVENSFLMRGQMAYTSRPTGCNPWKGVVSWPGSPCGAVSLLHWVIARVELSSVGGSTTIVSLFVDSIV